MTPDEPHRPEIVVGLVATPPDHPAQVAARLTAELADRLAERVSADVRWTARQGWGDVAPRRDGGAEALLDDLARRRADESWDVAVCLTDLPLHADRMPLVAQTSAQRRVAMVSLPALGLRQLQAVRTVVPDLVGRLLTDSSDQRVPPAGGEPAGLTSRVPAIGGMVGEGDAGELRYVASRLIGRVRLLIGMVRANRPGRALLGLSKLLVGVLGTAAFSLTTSTIWQVGDALGGLRLTVIMLLGLTALVAWLIVAHDLWEKPDRETPAELARMFNVGTILTLTLATAVSYVVLFAGTLLAAALLIDTSVLEQTLRRPVDVTDYLTLTWIISSLATVGGAIGSGLEDEETVRAAAYGYHPEPGGWQDEKTGDPAAGQASPSHDRAAG
ncbi:5,10-methylene-tetrahydrofolate dehydrogenase [Pseudonocardia xinjiangensis]|uniref:5,10-methylene-tetrahydrofolate dehydrogenase n=1 Tax=Pseudonocardia xinjiangensis TaxID=75289 RepID=UPI003D8D4E45